MSNAQTEQLRRAIGRCESRARLDGRKRLTIARFALARMALGKPKRAVR